MKKFSFILVLVFAYFVCIVNVFAVAPNGSCVNIDNSSNVGYVYFNGCSFNGVVRDNSDYHGYGPYGSSQYSEVGYSDYSQGTWVDNYNLFGTYENGNLIHYSRPPHADDWYGYSHSIYLWHQNEAYTDNNGNVNFYSFFQYNTYFDFDFGYIVPNGRTSRLDFAIHINLTDIPDNVRENILGNLIFDTIMPNNSQSLCSAVYQNDTIRISCSFLGNGSNTIVRLSNLVPSDYNYNNLVISYTYRGYFDISDYSYVWGPSDVNFNDKFNNLDSPNGSIFSDNYDYSSINSDISSFFNDFQLPSNFNSLTQIVTSPIAFLNQLSTESHSNLSFSIFGKSITLQNGNDLFWYKSSFHSVPNGSNPVTLRDNFRRIWNFIVVFPALYFTGLKAFKVTKNVFDPLNSETEVF